METFNLNLIPSGTCPVCHVSQYDIGRQFRINLFEGSSVFTLSGAETITVYVRKPDGNMVTESVTNTSSNYVVIETTEQMTACDGANLCELRIENGGDRIGTLNFVMECEKSPDTGITSQTEINNLETLVDGFTALAVADQYDSANVIFDNAPTSGHGNGYAVTSDGIYNAIDGLYGYIDVRSDYFINEKVIGTWIDSKSIYRCVFTGFNMTSTADTWIETTINAGNISTLINGRILDNSGQSFNCSLGYSNGKVAINMPLARTNLTTLILEYTKT